MVKNVLKGFVRRHANELARRLGIKGAGATVLPAAPKAKAVEARVLNPESGGVGAPPKAKSVVRVLPGTEQNWIKKL
jgi:hypothetical protein